MRLFKRHEPPSDTEPTAAEDQALGTSETTENAQPPMGAQAATAPEPSAAEPELLVETECQPDPNVAIDVRELRKHFGDFVAVNGIDLEVKRGEIFGFLGPNGSGKTTTIRMLCGVIGPTDGSANVLGCDVVADPELVRQRIGYMSQKFSLFEDLTVDENLRFYAGIYGLPPEKFAERRDYVLDMADLRGRENELTANLSVGWKQRLALGCATIHEPELIFLDEPTSGVDPTARRQFWDLLYDLAASGVTLFVTTHYMDEATHCSRLAFIYEGDIIADGSPTQIRHEFMYDRIVEIDVSDVDHALTVLEAAPDIPEAYMSGAVLHANAGHRADAIDLVDAHLRAAGISPHSIETVEPTLEDVFVHLVSAQRAARAPEPSPSAHVIAAGDPSQVAQDTQRIE